MHDTDVTKVKTTVVRFSTFYYQHLCYFPSNASPSVNMFLWPFVVTGTFFLTLLNPPYTGMLLLRSISRSHSLLLGSSSPACLEVSDTPFLVQSPWLPLSHRHYPLALPAPHRSNSTTAIVVSSEVFLPAASRPLAASLPWSWSYSLPRQHDIITWILSCGKSLSLALYALILCVACWIVNRFRVPQPGSPALVFVDSLHKEVRSFTVLQYITIFVDHRICIDRTSFHSHCFVRQPQ